MFVTKLFHHVPILLSIILFGMILYRLSRSVELAFLFTLIFLSVTQASKHTSLFLDYPFYFTFSFSLLLISFLCLLRYLETSRKYQLILSVLLFTLGLIFSEIYLVYLVIYIIFTGIHLSHAGSPFIARLKKTVLILLPFIGVTLVYVVVYFLYRTYHPSQYIGTMFESKNLTFTGVLSTIWNLSYASYPITMFEENRQLLSVKSELVSGHSPIVLYMILQARVEWLIKGICVAVVGFILLDSVGRFNYRFLLAGSGWSVLLIFLPQVPLAFTVKYLLYVTGGMKGYYPTFFSLFGTGLLICLLLAYLVNLLNFNRLVKRGVIFFLSAGLFVLSVLTDLNNYTMAQDTRQANLRLYAMDELMKTSSFQLIPSQSTFYTRDLYRNVSFNNRGLTEQNFSWGQYMTVKTGREYQVYRKFQDIPVPPPGETKPIYSLAAQQAAKSEEVLLVLAKLPQKKAPEDLPAQFVDQIWLLYYSPYKTFSVTFRIRDDFMAGKSSLYVNKCCLTIKPGKDIELTIYNPQDTELATFFMIQAPGIDLANIRISDIVNQESPVFTIWPGKLN